MDLVEYSYYIFVTLAIAAMLVIIFSEKIDKYFFYARLSVFNLDRRDDIDLYLKRLVPPPIVWEKDGLIYLVSKKSLKFEGCKYVKFGVRKKLLKEFM